MRGKGIMGGGTVGEGAFCRSARAGKRCAAVAGGIKDQTAPPSERVSFDPSNGQWKVHHQIACDCVHVGADSGFSETAKIVLSIPAETVIPLRREPPVDVITVSHLKSTSV